MGILRKLLMLGLATCTVALLQYEFVAKSGPWTGGQLPGWYETRLVERNTPYVPWTGMPLVDHIIHEGQEAALYYSVLLRREPRSVVFASRSARIAR